MKSCRIKVGDVLRVAPSWHYDKDGDRIAAPLNGKVIYVNSKNRWILLEFEVPNGTVKESFKIMGEDDLHEDVPDVVKHYITIHGDTITDCKYGGVCCGGANKGKGCVACGRLVKKRGKRR